MVAARVSQHRRLLVVALVVVVAPFDSVSWTALVVRVTGNNHRLPFGLVSIPFHPPFLPTVPPVWGSFVGRVRTVVGCCPAGGYSRSKSPRFHMGSAAMA